MSDESRTGMNAEWFRQWEQSVTKWWDTVLEDPKFVQGMGDNLAGRAQVRTTWEDGVDRTMEQMHLPSKRDLVRLARIASLLEDRLVATEDALAETHERLARLEKETLRGRIESAEALLAMQERLDALTAELARVSAAAPSTPAPARRARGPKG